MAVAGHPLELRPVLVTSVALDRISNPTGIEPRGLGHGVDGM